MDGRTMSPKSRKPKRGRKVEANDRPMRPLARAYNEAFRNDTEPGTPRRGWTIGGGPEPDHWPRNMSKKIRVAILFGQVPQVLNESGALMRATQALQWVQIADSVDHVARDAARQIVMGELWRVTQALDRKAALMAELVRLRDSDADACQGGSHGAA